MKAWDEEMIQRQSKAYDDVENFRQQVHRQLPLHDQSDGERSSESQSTVARSPREDDGGVEDAEGPSGWIAAREMPSLNKRLWDLGYGVIWKN